MEISTYLNLLKEHRALRRFSAWRRNLANLRYGFGLVRSSLRNRTQRIWRDFEGAYIPLADGTFFFVPRELELHGYTMLSKGGEENYIATVLSHFCKPNTVAIDVGANIGEMTLPLAKLMGSGGKVIAFEPIPFLANAIARTARINGLEQVRTVNAAVSSSSGSLHIEVQYDDSRIVDSGGSHLIAEATATSVEVPTVVLDDWLREEGESRRISILKIDVEGHELNVLEGARRVLLEHQPALCIEIGHEGDTTRAKIAQMLQSVGYEPVAVIFRAALLPLTWEQFVSSTSPLSPRTNYDVLLLPKEQSSSLVRDQKHL